MKRLPILAVSLFVTWLFFAASIHLLIGFDFWLWLICATPSTLLLIAWTAIRSTCDRQDQLIETTRNQYATTNAKLQAQRQAQQFALARLDQTIARINENPNAFTN